MRKWTIVAIWLILGGAGWLMWTRWVVRDFKPIDINLDFSHRPGIDYLKSDWEVEPVEGWPGVFRAFPKTSPAYISLELPEAVPYVFRLKAVFLHPSARITSTLNEHPIGDWSPSLIGQAEKRQHLVPSLWTHSGTNRIRLDWVGPPRSILFEQVRFRNFRSKIWDSYIHLVPNPPMSSSNLTPSLAIGWFAGLFLLTATLAVLSGWIGGWSWVRVMHISSIGWLVVAVVVLGAMVWVPFVSYRPVVTPVGFGGIWSIFFCLIHGPILLVALGKRLGVVLPLGYVLIRGKWPEGQQSILKKAQWVGLLFLSIGKALFTWTVRLLAFVIRWIRSNQTPVGYLKMSGVALGLSILTGWCKWTRGMSVPLGHTAGILLMVALGFKAMQDLFREEDVPSHLKSSQR